VLVEQARLQAAEGLLEQAVETLAFALAHPATEEQTRALAERTLTTLCARLPAERAEAARSRGRTRSLDEVLAARQHHRPTDAPPRALATVRE